MISSTEVPKNAAFNISNYSKWAKRVGDLQKEKGGFVETLSNNIVSQKTNSYKIASNASSYGWRGQDTGDNRKGPKPFRSDTTICLTHNLSSSQNFSISLIDH